MQFVQPAHVLLCWLEMTVGADRASDLLGHGRSPGGHVLELVGRGLAQPGQLFLGALEVFVGGTQGAGLLGHGLFELSGTTPQGARPQPLHTRAGEEMQALADRGLVFSPYRVPDAPVQMRGCDICRTRVPKAGMIHLVSVGRFCSEPCAQAGVERHEALMRRIETLHNEMPWLAPQAKETA